MDLVSVLMPVYNVEQYVAEAINSILKQTYQNFELIIIDDCSTDRTLDICKEFALNDKRIIIIHNERNLKIEGSLNKGLEKCQGKYIVRMDGDDISLPDRFEKLKSFLDEHKDIVLVGTSVEIMDKNGHPLGFNNFPSEWDLIKKTCILKIPVAHIWMTYKYIYDELNGYRQLSGTEDYDFLLRLITKGYKFTNIENYYGYKIRLNRIGNSADLFGIQKIKSKNFTIKMYKQRLNKKNDKYSYAYLQKYVYSNSIEKKIYNLSNKFLYKAIDCRYKRNYVGIFFNSLLAMISPLQIKYLIESLKYKQIVRKYNNGRI